MKLYETFRNSIKVARKEAEDEADSLESHGKKIKPDGNQETKLRNSQPANKLTKLVSKGTGK